MASHRGSAALAGAILALCVTAGCGRQKPTHPLEAVYVDAAHVAAGEWPAARPALPAALTPPEPISPLTLSPLPSAISSAGVLAPARDSRSLPILDAAKERLQQLEGFLLARADRILERERAQAQRLASRARIEGQQRLTRDLAVAEAQREADLRSVRNRFGPPLLALEGTLRRVAADQEASERIAAQVAAIQGRLADEEARARFRDAQRRTATAERYQDAVTEAERTITANIERRAAELRADARSALAEHRAAILATTLSWSEMAAGPSSPPLPEAHGSKEVRPPAFLRYKTFGPVRLSDVRLPPALLDARRVNTLLQVEATGRAAGWRVVFVDAPGLPNRTREISEMRKQAIGFRAKSDGDLDAPN